MANENENNIVNTIKVSDMEVQPTKKIQYKEVPRALLTPEEQAEYGGLRSLVNDGREDLLNEPNEKYRCMSCGEKYDQQDGNFAKVFSVLYAGNNYYLPVCKDCLRNLYDQYYYMLGDKVEAIKRMCMKFDIYFNPRFAATVDVKTKTTSVFKKYLNQVTFKPNTGKTYDIYMYENFGQEYEVPKDEEEISIEKKLKANQKKMLIRKWGNGFSDSELNQMEDEYNEFLKGQQNKKDIVVQSLIKDLCKTSVLKNRAIMSNAISDVDKLSKLYRSTAKELNATPKEQTTNEEAACLSKWVTDISKYCPADYFSNKRLFKDYDRFLEYFKRFIVRPCKNLFKRKKEKDSQIDITTKSQEEIERAIDEINDKILITDEN